MKKIFMLSLIIFSVASLIASTASGQVFGLGKRLGQYSASNGKTYHVGDTLKLGQGSAPNGTFRYVQYGGWLVFMRNGNDGDDHNIEKTYSGYGAVIKKIHSFKAHGIAKVVFAVDIGQASNFDMWIEDAIATCEIVDCKGKQVQATVAVQSDDQFDKLKKLKALLDSGAITQTEYDEQKKKLLKQ